jgi:hypothetical protein
MCMYIFLCVLVWFEEPEWTRIYYVEITGNVSYTSGDDLGHSAVHSGLGVRRAGDRERDGRQRNGVGL